MGEINWNCWDDGGFPSTLTKGHSMGPVLGGSNNGISLRIVHCLSWNKNNDLC